MSHYAKAHMTYAVYKRNGKQLMVSQSRLASKHDFKYLYYVFFAFLCSAVRLVADNLYNISVLPSLMLSRKHFGFFVCQYVADQLVPSHLLYLLAWMNYPLYLLTWMNYPLYLLAWMNYPLYLLTWMNYYRYHHHRFCLDQHREFVLGHGQCSLVHHNNVYWLFFYTYVSDMAVFL
jgi:hypothetical protein